MFQTFLVTVANFIGVGHFALFLLFLLRKLRTILQFQLSWNDVLVSPETQNVEGAAIKD